MEDEIKKPSFLVYYDNEVVVLRLPDKEAGKLFKSLFPYGREEIKPDFEKNPALAMAFDILSMAIDRDKEKYVKRCEKNRENIQKRWTKASIAYSKFMWKIISQAHPFCMSNDILPDVR